MGPERMEENYCNLEVVECQCMLGLFHRGCKLQEQVEEEGGGKNFDFVELRRENTDNPRDQTGRIVEAGVDSRFEMDRIQRNSLVVLQSRRTVVALRYCVKTYTGHPAGNIPWQNVCISESFCYLIQIDGS